MYFVQILVLNVHHKLNVQLVLKDMCYLMDCVRKPAHFHVTVVQMEYVKNVLVGIILVMELVLRMFLVIIQAHVLFAQENGLFVVIAVFPVQFQIALSVFLKMQLYVLIV